MGQDQQAAKAWVAKRLRFEAFLSDLEAIDGQAEDEGEKRTPQR